MGITTKGEIVAVFFPASRMFEKKKPKPNIKNHRMQCFSHPDGCSVAALVNSTRWHISGRRPSPDVAVWVRPRTHTETGHANWQSASNSTCDSTCVSICGPEMPVVLVCSQCASSTVSQPPSMSLSAACPRHSATFVDHRRRKRRLRKKKTHTQNQTLLQSNLPPPPPPCGHGTAKCYF